MTNGEHVQRWQSGQTHRCAVRPRHPLAFPLCGRRLLPLLRGSQRLLLLLFLLLLLRQLMRVARVRGGFRDRVTHIGQLTVRVPADAAAVRLLARGKDAAAGGEGVEFNQEKALSSSEACLGKRTCR